jgi:restriction system protein
MTDDWYEYQEEAAEFFRGLGLEAKTNVSLKGIRTSHDIDVVVRSHHVGFEVLWLVECKHWKERVSKLHVLALRQIVIDVGADRGILLCECGFQSGALEAANLTNVTLMSLSDVKTNARQQVVSMRLRELYDRMQSCRERYWNIPKNERIEHGLRPDVGLGGYRGTNALDIATELLSKAFRGTYPISAESVAAVTEGIPNLFKTAEEIVAVVEPLLITLESKLDDFDKHAKQ